MRQVPIACRVLSSLFSPFKRLIFWFLSSFKVACTNEPAGSFTVTIIAATSVVMFLTMEFENLIREMQLDFNQNQTHNKPAVSQCIHGCISLLYYRTVAFPKKVWKSRTHRNWNPHDDAFADTDNFITSTMHCSIKQVISCLLKGCQHKNTFSHF